MRFDHVVYFTDRSPAVIVDEQRSENVHTVFGGRHEQWGTYNALHYFGNGYVEWLAIEKEDIAQKATQPLVQLLQHDLAKCGEGWGTICFSVTDLASLKQRLQNDGFHPSPIYHAERQTIDGKRLKWRMLFIQQTPDASLPDPFFIEWEQSVTERFNELRKSGTLLQNNEQKVLSHCLFLVKDPRRHSERWSRLLGVNRTIDEKELVLGEITLRFEESKRDHERLAAIRFSEGNIMS